jgi:hypothetical protein
MRKHESCQHVRLKLREYEMEPRRFMRPSKKKQAHDRTTRNQEEAVRTTALAVLVFGLVLVETDRGRAQATLPAAGVPGAVYLQVINQCNALHVPLVVE